jgi:hypothetical protein|tara:strand:+ start:1252 stop:1707 length:456 start_codon:yes stop_codon:yes gene_type:complete
MPQVKISPEKLQEIKSYFESPKIHPKPGATAKHFGIPVATLNYHIKTKDWFPAWKSHAKSNKIFQRKMDEIIEEEAESEAEKKLVAVRHTAHNVAATALKDFEASRPEIKDFHEATKALDMAERGLGIKEDDGASIGLQIGFLSSPQVIDV